MKIFLLINLMFLSFFNPACSFENADLPRGGVKTELPPEMPENLAINFNANYGMSPAFKKIEIKNGEISFNAKDYVTEKQTFESTDRTAPISRADLAALYRVFVENEFDTIKNDERKNITYDAPSEGIFISVSEQKYFQKSFGDNKPMSGGNKKRYENVKKAIFELSEKYAEQKQIPVSTENQQVFEYGAGELSHYAKNAAPAKLKADDFKIIEATIQKTVDEYNEKQAVRTQKIGSLSGYKRQLIPYLNANGEKEVFINFFCSANGLNWRKIIVEVDDGGSCYFSMRIKLANKSVFNFIVNGAA